MNKNVKVVRNNEGKIVVVRKKEYNLFQKIVRATVFSLRDDYQAYIFAAVIAILGFTLRASGAANLDALKNIDIIQSALGTFLMVYGLTDEKRSKFISVAGLCNLVFVVAQIVMRSF